MDTGKDVLRTCIFSPYLKGKGPRFRLTTWATPRTDSRGQTVIGYRLEERPNPWRFGPKWVTLFEGEDFAGSPLHADDSDATVRSLMTFLTLRPRDTDPEYFASYTARQLAYCALHAEALDLEVLNRFGEY